MIQFPFTVTKLNFSTHFGDLIKAEVFDMKLLCGFWGICAGLTGMKQDLLDSCSSLGRCLHVSGSDWDIPKSTGCS